jgi:hypothetical protein
MCSRPEDCTTAPPPSNEVPQGISDPASLLNYLTLLVKAEFPGATTGEKGAYDQHGRPYTSLAFHGPDPVSAADLMRAELVGLKARGGYDVLFRTEPWFQFQDYGRAGWVCRTRFSCNSQGNGHV